MTGKTLAQTSQSFIEFLESWQNDLPRKPLTEIVTNPEKTAILSMDMINGFCTTGALASPRVQAIVPRLTSLFTSAWEMGVRHIILTQDTHDPDALEFEAYAPHCIRGTAEAETIPEFKALPFFDQMVIFEKNSISSNINTGLNAWIEAHPEVDTWLLVGNCTDICVYQSALFLRLQANELRLQRRVIVASECVNTYDLPVETAKSIGALPHNGGLLHAVFLYHMALNGVEVIKGN
jgi:nicotinamidase-related amidase